MPQLPYAIRGVIQKNSVVQTGVDVKIKNVTKNEEYTKKTDVDGKYWVSLSDITKFPSGYSDNDSITITVETLDVQKSTTVDTAILEGRLVNINLIIVELTETLEGTHSFSYWHKVYCLSETVEPTHTLALTKILTMSETLQLTHIWGLPTKLCQVSQTLQATASCVLPLKLCSISEAVEGVPFTFLRKVFSLTETVEATSLFQTTHFISLTEYLEATHTLKLPFRLYALTQNLQGIHVLSVHGIIIQLTETVEGSATISARRQLTLEETLQATHSLLLPLRVIAETALANPIHILTSPIRNLLFADCLEGTATSYAMKAFPFTETLEGECGVDQLLIIVPSADLIQFTEALEATHEIERHKTYFVTETVEGTPTTALALKLVLGQNIIEAVHALLVPLHPVVSTEILEGTHQLGAARVIILNNIVEPIHQLVIPKLFTLTEYVEGLPDLKLPQRPALLQQIITGLPQLAAEAPEPIPFTTTLNIRRRNLTLKTEKRKLKLSVKKRQLILRIKGERD